VGFRTVHITMKFLFVLAAVLATTQALSLDTEWELFKLKYQRNYLSSDEHDTRKTVFAENLNLIQKHNAEEALGLHTFTLGVNEFADLTNEEFVRQFNGLVGESQLPQQEEFESIGDLPEAKDWRDDGYVTAVKNQGGCGSCWAFSAVGTMEGAHFKKTGKLVSLSEQNLVDCDTKQDMGCHGGLPVNAINFVIQEGGIDTEQSYPYLGRSGNCQFKENNIGATFKAVKQVKSKDEAALQQAVATIGPISVGIDASHFSFQLYHSGVYHSMFCSQTALDHGVLVAGYGTENGKDYWLVKNSWGSRWGESGYIKMSRNRNNNCGIATMAVYAVA